MSARKKIEKSNLSLGKMFLKLTDIARSKGFFAGRTVNLRICLEAVKEHEKSERQFMHTNHRPDTVCFCPEAAVLPLENQLGLLVHEIGHLVLLPKPHTEPDANAAGRFATGIDVWLEGDLKLEKSNVPENWR